MGNQNINNNYENETHPRRNVFNYLFKFNYYSLCFFRARLFKINLIYWYRLYIYFRLW